MRYNSPQRGYTLLFATLTATVVLGVAIFITSVARKQYILAATARDSMFSIYNADSAIECAATVGIGLTPSGDTFYCNNVQYTIPALSVMAVPPDGWGETYESSAIKVSFGTGKGCATVSFLASADDLKHAVSARGYNLGDGTTCPTIGPRTVERAMRVTYGLDN